MKTLKQLIASHKFDYVNSHINDENFPHITRTHEGYKLFHFDRHISSEVAIAEMAKEGYSPATLHELLGWTEWNSNDWVVALGSVALVDGRRRVPFLDEDDAGRDLCLGWWDGGWGGGRFLAVRNSQNLDSQTSAPLDTLALCVSDLEKLLVRVKALVTQK